MTNDVLFTQMGQLGLITLNRPSALNALTLPMILAMQKQLAAWEDDSNIQAMVIRAVPGNAFCAGGDVRSLYEAGKKKAPDLLQFFWHEYRLNHFIHHLKKPYIALMDGITMGGGVGVSMHGSHPVASEKFVFAMPETTIGFFPDVGASHLLNRCPGALGVYLGLTGNRLGSFDALKASLVKHVVASDQMQVVLDTLTATDLSSNGHEKVKACLNKHAIAANPDEISQIKPLIDDCFSPSSVELIRQALQTSDGPWAIGVDNALEKKSPLSLKITLAQLQKSKGLSLAECLKMDFDLVKHFMQGTDFYEGVRALLVDKDKNPRWEPAQLDAVSDRLVISYFEHSGDELAFD